MNRLLRIARREYLSYLRTPGFWISLLIAPLFAAFSGFVPVLMEHGTPRPLLTVVDRTGLCTSANPCPGRELAPGAFVVRTLKRRPDTVQIVDAPADVADAPDPGEAARPYIAGQKRLDGDLRLDAAVILKPGARTGAPVEVDLWTRNLSDPTVKTAVREAVGDYLRRQALLAEGLDPGLLARLDAIQPDVRDFSPNAARGRVLLRDRLPTMLGFGLAFMLWAVMLTGAGMLLNSVIEEKANRVLEVLLSSASTAEILAGKILGVAGLSGTVLVVWAGLAIFAVSRLIPGIRGDLAAALLAHGLIVWFLLYFVAGYLMYASIFAAIGSFCETTREAQALLGPLMIFLSVPMLFMSLAIRRPDAPLVTILSWIPPFTPFLMTARIGSGPPLVQVLGALILMIATAAVVVWLSARAFRTGALSSGKLEPKLFFASLFGRAEPVK